MKSKPLKKNNSRKNLEKKSSEKFSRKKSEKNFSKNKRNFQEKKISVKIPNDAKIITWVYSDAQNYNFWFVDIEWQEKWYFVHPKNKNDTLHWDTVEAFVKAYNWREEAVITKIIKRTENAFIGTLNISKSFGFVVLENNSIKNDVFIPWKYLKNYKDKDKVAVKIIKWEGKNPEWIILENLTNKPDSDVLKLILENGLNTHFSDKVLDEANKVVWNTENRKNLKNILTFTIDGADARDLDDAISLEELWENYKLIVSIADVSEYVKERSTLDKEAFKRGNSTYLPDRVIPMLPEKISNDLCSLNPGTDKLTLSCEIVLDKKWNILASKVYESIIKSDFRLTYLEVQDILYEKLNIWEKLSFWKEITQELKNALENTLKLKKIITNKKKEFWVLNFDFPETKIILDENNNPIEIKKYTRYESHKIIEEFMILANQVVWKTFSNLPFVYRIHPKPSEEDIEKLRNILKIFWVVVPNNEISPILLAQVLDEIKNSSKEKLLSKMVLRSLTKAIYSDINEWHFGLWLEFYSHFTSPIRRYSDLIAHRIIKQKINKELTKQKKTYYNDKLESITKHISATERKSEKLEYAVKDLFICKYFKDKVWETFKAQVSGMIPLWFFVELENWGEWLVLLENYLKQKDTKLKNYNEESMIFELISWEKIQVWDEIEVILDEVDLEKNRLNFKVK